MIILYVALASLVVAWLRGAPPWALGTLRLRWLALPLVALAAQWVAFVTMSGVSQMMALAVQVVSAACLVAFLLANLRYRTLGLVALGMAMNLVVTVANGGRMPVRVDDLAAIGFPDEAALLRERGTFQKSVPLDGSTRLPWLADVVPVPLPGGPGRMISLGDAVVAAGAALFIQEALVGRRRASRRHAPVPAAVRDAA